MASSSWTLNNVLKDKIVWLTLNKVNSATNVLSRKVIEELNIHLEFIEAIRPRGVVILSGKENGFVAGADINEFKMLNESGSAYELIRAAQKVMDRLAQLPCPTVAVLNGFALGGGLELALACRYRIGLGDDRLKLALPEVQLGIHPGFGGTVRAVQLIGAPAALDLMITGRFVRAAQALRLGLVDRLCMTHDALEASAVNLILREPPIHRPSWWEKIFSWRLGRYLFYYYLAIRVSRAAKREYYPAPYAILKLWAKYGCEGEGAYEAEARSITKLFTTNTSKNLVRIFLLRDHLKSKVISVTKNIKNIHIVGTGVMGSDIAILCAVNGFRVTLQDRNIEYITAALERARSFFEKNISNPIDLANTTENLRADPEGLAIGRADVVIEAITESVQAKIDLYKKVEPLMMRTAILASNTSSIPLEDLIPTLNDPSRFLGLHFFNPVSKMPLVEIVRSHLTAQININTMTNFILKLEKIPFPCISSPGFLVNRVLVPYMQEAMYAAQEGVPLNIIDKVARNFGMPIGPVELADMVGLDVCGNVGEILNKSFGRGAPDLAQLDALIYKRKLGKKSGEGFYRWRKGIAQKGWAWSRIPADLEDRLILSIANECVACLRQGIVSEADLIDAGIIFGSGYAPFRGGPLTEARRRGIPACVERLEELAIKYGSRFKPDEGWAHFR